MNAEPNPLPNRNHARWDLFCRVIDNFGDIGVTWRLARILADEHQRTVRLWVDDLTALATLVPSVDATAQRQKRQKIEIRRWPETFPVVTPAEVVIEAFGCALPPRYLAAMPAHSQVWFNLEYFTAEPWAAACHGLPSPQANGVPKIFAIPGIEPGTGGLLREADLRADRERFLQEDDRRKRWAARWRIPLPAENQQAILLFGYENAALGDLVHALATAPSPVMAYLPEGRLLNSARTALNQPDLAAGTTYRQGNLTLQVLSFLPQAEFDRLLWLCDLNFVRGEDSLARALWAGKPLVWQIYPTEDEAHWAKLDALLTASGQRLTTEAFSAWRDVSHDWNRQRFNSAHWQRLIDALPQLNRHAERRMVQLAAGDELARWLVKTAEQRLQCATI